MNASRNIRIFISYCSLDETLKSELIGFLKGLQAEGVTLWDDSALRAGEAWHPAIRDALLQSDLAIVLVSQAFLDSAYIRDHEVPLMQQLAESRGMRLLPLLLSECEWLQHPWLARLQMHPRKGSLESALAVPGQRSRVLHEFRQVVRGHVARLRERDLWSRPHLRQWGRPLLWAAGVAAVAVALAASDSYQPLAWRWHALVQEGLELIGQRQPLQVVLLDSRDLGTPDQPTSRALLRQSLDDIAALEPLAIGVAINFSPAGPGRYVDPENDPGFFAHCRQLDQERQLRIFLGTAGNEGNAAATWLGSIDYAGLAASVFVPREPGTHWPARFEGSDGRTLPSMSVALAEVMLQVRPRRDWPAWLVAGPSTKSPALGMVWKTHVIDLSSLHRLRLASVPLAPGAMKGRGWQDRLQWKIVVIGDLSPKGEAALWGDGASHAALIGAGAQSLVEGPLAQLRWSVRLVFALALMLLLVASCEWIRRRRLAWGLSPVGTRGAWRAALSLVGGVWVGAVASVAWLRLWWPEAPLLAAAAAAYLFWRRIDGRQGGR